MIRETATKKLQRYISNKSITCGDIVFLKKDGIVHHALLVGKISRDDCFYYAHSDSTNAKKEFRKSNGIGLKQSVDKETIIIIKIGGHK